MEGGGGRRKTWQTLQISSPREREKQERKKGQAISFWKRKPEGYYRMERGGKSSFSPLRDERVVGGRDRSPFMRVIDEGRGVKKNT